MGFRPVARDVWIAIIALLIYTLVLIPLNYSFDFDYGYVGPTSETVAFLGPWPARAFILLLLEITAFIVLWLPFAIAERKRCAASRTPGPGVPDFPPPLLRGD
jgi:uncharacterized membrane protein YwaF